MTNTNIDWEAVRRREEEEERAEHARNMREARAQHEQEFAEFLRSLATETARRVYGRATSD